MKKLAVLVTVGLALVAFGCASGMKTKSGKEVTSESKVKCPKCGASFTIEEGLKESGP